MRQRVKDVAAQGDRLFADRYPLLTLWQAQADNFHPLRATFTRQRAMSEEIASYMMTGRPALARHELENALSFMLRPRDQQWFHARTDSERINADAGAKSWLDWASATQRRAVYDRRALFLRATNLADGDFLSFGNTVITIEPRRALDGIFHRCWHLRDVAWSEDAEQQIEIVNFNWTPTVRNQVALFPETVAAKVKTAAEKEPFTKVRCRRMLIPADQYDLSPQKLRGRPIVSVTVDLDNDVVLEEKPLNRLDTIIPRFKTDGSQYGWSPPAFLGLPEARLLQQIVLAMLEASQKAIDPPMIEVGEMIAGGVNLAAGTTTSVDPDYDERTGEVLRPIRLQLEGIKYGAEREQRTIEGLNDAWFLSKLQFPQLNKEMRVDEVRQLIQQFIRQNLPLFEPIEQEYNAALCELQFFTLRDMGTFGSILDMPQALRARDVHFQFDSPIQQAATRVKAQSFQETQALVAIGGQMDPTVPLNVDWHKATRAAVQGTEAPADWLLEEDEVAQLREEEAQRRQAEQAAAALAAGADVASRAANAGENVGRAAEQLQRLGLA